MTLTRGTLFASLARRSTAPTAWNVQPLQQHHAEGDSGDTAAEDTVQSETSTDTTDTTDDTAAQRDADKPTEDKSDKDTTDWKAQARKHEQRAKENAAAAKELADLKRSKMDDQQKAEAAAQESIDRAEKAERRAALLQAAVDHKLGKDDLALLEDVPADKIEDRAKALAARLAKVAPATQSGTEAGGARKPGKPVSLDSAVAAHYAQ